MPKGGGQSRELTEREKLEADVRMARSGLQWHEEKFADYTTRVAVAEKVLADHDAQMMPMSTGLAL